MLRWRMGMRLLYIFHLSLQPRIACFNSKIDCPGLEPCQPVYNRVCFSGDQLTHAEALNYCESNAMFKSGIKNIGTLRGYFGAFEDYLSKSLR